MNFLNKPESGSTVSNYVGGAIRKSQTVSKELRKPADDSDKVVKIPTYRFKCSLLRHVFLFVLLPPVFRWVYL